MQGVDVQKSEIGARLKEERSRLKRSQTEFAELAGVSKRAQITYEKGESTPDAAYLYAVSREGVDVQYIITGIRSLAGLTNDETELLERYRAAPLVLKAAAIGALVAGAESPPAGRKEQVFHGQVGQAVKVEGDLDQSGISFFGKERKKK